MKKILKKKRIEKKKPVHKKIITNNIYLCYFKLILVLIILKLANKLHVYINLTVDPIICLYSTQFLIGCNYYCYYSYYYTVSLNPRGRATRTHAAKKVKNP